MSRMNHRARRRAKFAKALEAPLARAAAPARTPRWYGCTDIVLAIMACAAIGYSASHLLPAQATSGAKPATAVIEGDGVKGPKGMVWVPGGEFLIGSNHKLAQKNERPRS
jgi:hypothetical protein